MRTPVATATGAVANAAGEATPQPQALAEIEDKAADLRITFERAEVDIEALLKSINADLVPSDVKLWEVVVQCGSKKSADELTAKLRKQGLECATHWRTAP